MTRVVFVLLACRAAAMAQGQKFQDLEEMGEALLEYINSSQTEKVKEIRSEQQALFELHVETKKVVTHILNGKWSFIA